MTSEPVIRKTVSIPNCTNSRRTGLSARLPRRSTPWRALYNDFHGKPSGDALSVTMDRLLRKMTVEPEKRSSVLQVAFRWGDPAWPCS